MNSASKKPAKRRISLWTICFSLMATCLIASMLVKTDVIYLSPDIDWFGIGFYLIVAVIVISIFLESILYMLNNNSKMYSSGVLKRITAYIMAMMTFELSSFILSVDPGDITSMLSFSYLSLVLLVFELIYCFIGLIVAYNTGKDKFFNIFLTLILIALILALCFMNPNKLM